MSWRWTDIKRYMPNYLPSRSHFCQIKLSDPWALECHADDQEEVDGRDGGEGQIPEPEKSEDFLWDDVWCQNTEVVLKGFSTTFTICGKWAFGYPWKGLVKNKVAVGLGVQEGFEPVITL